MREKTFLKHKSLIQITSTPISTLIFTLSFTLILGLSQGCATAHKAPSDSSEVAASDSTVSAEAKAESTEILELKKQVEALQTKVTSLEAKLATPAIRETHEIQETPLESQSITPLPTDGNGLDVAATVSSKDPDAGFVQDESVQMVRKAMLLFNAQKYAEAGLAFASFLDRHPDHPWAGTAQYYIGECYLRQKDYAKAIQEFNKVLTSYDRSSHVSITLRQLAEAHDLLSQPEAAAKNRQQLLSLFPQSPAADFTTPTIIQMQAPEPTQTTETTKPEAPSTATAPSAPSGTSGLDAPPPTAPIENTKGAPGNETE